MQFDLEEHGLWTGLYPCDRSACLIARIGNTNEADRRLRDYAMARPGNIRTKIQKSPNILKITGIAFFRICLISIISLFDNSGRH
jgi:hypothetical protein